MDIDKSDLSSLSGSIVPSSSFFDPNMAIMGSTWGAEHSTFSSVYIEKEAVDLLTRKWRTFWGFTKSQNQLETVSLKNRVMTDPPFWQNLTDSTDFQKQDGSFETTLFLKTQVGNSILNDETGDFQFSKPLGRKLA